MTLIFGGAYQGKLDYARARFNFAPEHIYHCSEDETSIPQGVTVINGLEKLLLAVIRGGGDTEDTVQRLLQMPGDIVVICTDISCGIVPLDPILREWREAVGRAVAALALRADEVVRLFCGIPTVLKKA